MWFRPNHNPSGRIWNEEIVRNWSRPTFCEILNSVIWLAKRKFKQRDWFIKWNRKRNSPCIKLSMGSIEVIQPRSTSRGWRLTLYYLGIGKPDGDLRAICCQAKMAVLSSTIYLVLSNNRIYHEKTEIISVWLLHIQIHKCKTVYKIWLIPKKTDAPQFVSTAKFSWQLLQLWTFFDEWAACLCQTMTTFWIFLDWDLGYFQVAQVVLVAAVHSNQSL